MCFRTITCRENPIPCMLPHYSLLPAFLSISMDLYFYLVDFKIKAKPTTGYRMHCFKRYINDVISIHIKKRH
jgi:hypothetical protein